TRGGPSIRCRAWPSTGAFDRQHRHRQLSVAASRDDRRAVRQSGRSAVPREIRRPESSAYLMNLCPNCGTTYPDEARFCSRDGARLVRQTPPVANPWVTASTPPPQTVRRARAEPPPSPQASLVGQVLQGRYEIVRRIGEGGMSVVYLATDVS